jgi:hypothetical protein
MRSHVTRLSQLVLFATSAVVAVPYKEGPTMATMDEIKFTVPKDKGQRN